MSAVLHGNLEDFGLADVLQLIGQQRKTGFLELEHEGENIRIGFDEGAVFSASPVRELEFSALGESLVRAGLLLASDFDRTTAQCRASARPLPDLWLEYDGLDEVILRQMMDRLTQETLFQVMFWSSGAFHFSPAQDLEVLLAADAVAVEKILMDGLRMLDEWRTFPVEVQTESHVFRVVKVPKNQDQADGDRLEILDWLDGKRSVRQLIDASRRTTFEVARQLSEAYTAGRIERVEAANQGGSLFLSRSHSPWLRAARWISATALPLVALACVVGLLSTDPYRGAFGGNRAQGMEPHAVAEAKFARLRDSHFQEASGLSATLSPHTGPDLSTAVRFNPSGAMAPESLAAYPPVEQPRNWVQAAPRR